MSDLSAASGLPRWHPPAELLEFAELVLTGVLARLPPGLPQAPQAGPVVLEDAEGTPVAILDPGAERALTPLRPFGQGPLRGARCTPSQVHQRWAEFGVVPGSDILAVPITGSLSTDAVKAIDDQAAGRPVLWIAVAGPGRTRDLPPVPLWRAVAALAGQSPEAAQAVPLVLPPAPAGGDDAGLVEEAARAFGATEVWLESPPGPRPARAAGLGPPSGMHHLFARAGQGRAQPRRYRGATIFFTGLSGSGKSTVAKALAERISEGDDEPGRTVSLLDGDEVRRLLSAGLGFSRADRDLNILRIGFVAAEITRHGGMAICAPIAPFAATREQVRERISAAGDFVLIHVNTPLAECERRDRKGLYAQARAGQIPEFTGISSPYEEPQDADLRLDTSNLSLDECVDQVLALVRARGLLDPA